MVTSKEQERKALKKIMDIVASLGEDSYVATAFEGCFEIAAQNIEDDFACSMKQRWESAEKEAEYFHTIANSEANENSKLEAEIERLRCEIEKYEERDYCAANTIGDMSRQIETLENKILDERKEVTIETTDGDHEHKAFSNIKFYNDNGFRFVNVVEKTGWTNSYKIEDLKTFVIE